MLDISIIATAILLAVVYGFADRFAGGGNPALDAKLPGRAAFWGAIAGALAGYILIGWPAVALAAVWLVWRTPKWALLKGASATPVGTSEIAATFVRHSIPIPGAFLIAQAFDLPVLPAVSAMAAFAAAATALAAWYGIRNQSAIEDGVAVDDDDNAFVEIARGAAFGIAAALAL